MAKSLISRAPKRVIFPPGRQKAFILECKKHLGLPFAALATLLKINQRTLTDWQREKFSMSLRAVRLLSQKTGQYTPKDVEVRQPYWYVTRGARVGGLVTYRKYGSIGDPEKRKQRWREWWEREGKYKIRPVFSPRPVRKPRVSKDLAEFAGIMIGDGGISRYQVTITLHYRDDLAYSKFVIALLQRLFGIVPRVYQRSAVNCIVISRHQLVKFCNEELGLPIGNKIKQQVDIPGWIKRNLNFQTACLRGLFDTDGSIITHRYKSKNRYYRYKKIGFTSRSLPLLKSVSTALDAIGIDHRLMGRYDIRIEAQDDVARYFRGVGTHNPKHLKRYCE